MGRVVLAHQRSLGREVAVKLLKPEVATPRVVASLLLEAQITGSLEHPNVVPVHALGRDSEGKPLLVMKRVEGVSWRDVLRDPVHPAWTRLLERSGDRLVASIEVLMAVCNAVQFAHSKGVIHRDIKPENVMIGAFGEVYLVDWGIACRLENSGDKVLVGTPGYMAPEMLDGDPNRLAPQTDVYLLGATLHEVLSGHPRHDGATLYEAMVHASENPPFLYHPEVPDELAALANDACSSEIARRPTSADAFRMRLAEWLRHRGVAALVARLSKRVDELEQLRAEAAGDSRHRRAFDQLATECRFGFSEALVQWPAAHGARRGLVRCLQVMLAVEVARENLTGARSLLEELEELEGASSALKAEVERVSERLKQKEAHDERGRQLLHDMDEGVSSRERMVFLAYLGSLLVFIGVVISWLGGIQLVTVQMTVIFGFAGFFATLLVALAMRKKLIANAFNRRVLSVALVTMLSMMLHRSSAWFRGETRVPTVLGDDLWIAAAVTTLAAFTVRSWFAWMSVICAAGAIAIHFAPQRTPMIFTLGLGGAILCALWIHRREMPKAPDSSRGPPSLFLRSHRRACELSSPGLGCVHSLREPRDLSGQLAAR